MSQPPQCRFSLVLVTVDCLRADHLGFLGYPRPTTPFLDSLAAESIVVPVGIVAGAPTYYSFPAIFASRHALDLGRDVVGLAPGESTLPSALRNVGYATAAFCAGNPYLTRRFGYEQGFDVFRDFLEQAPKTSPEAARNGELGLGTRINRKLDTWSHSSRWLGRIYDDLYFEYCQRLANSIPDSLDALRRYPSADILVEQAKEWVRSTADRPFFLWLHFMDPHAPYYPVHSALQLMGNETSASGARYLNSYWNRGNLPENRFQQHRESIVALYDAGVRWVDTQVARVVESLRDFGIWDNCVLAFTADHGEEFLDHGGRFHSPSNVGEEVTRVPLLLRVPGQEPFDTGNAPFSLLHLAPSLLDVLGVEAPHEFLGNSYWRRFHDRNGWDEPAIIECVTGATNPFHRRDRIGPRILVVRDKRFKLVWELGVKDEVLFDLDRDPKELRPLSAHEATDARRRLMLRARQHLTESRERRDEKLRCRALVRELAMEWKACENESRLLEKTTSATVER
jgi:arylsulfatase A-like enzyme